MKKNHLLQLIALGVMLLPLPWFAVHLLSSMNSAQLPVTTRPNGAFHLRAYSDTSEGGNSQCTYSSSGSDTISFTFTLRNGYSKPFAGIAIEPNPAGSTIDLSAYDSLIFFITRSCADTQDVKINLHTPFNGNTGVRPLGVRINEKIAPCLMKTNRIATALRNFDPPVWWCEKCKIPCSSLPQERFSRVQALIFQSGDTTPRDEEITFSISGIIFKKNVAGRVRRTVLTLLLYYLLFCALFFAWWRPKAAKRRSSEKATPPYTPLAVNNYLDEESQRVVTCLGEHFHNPDMTLESAARESGIHQKKLSQILNRKFKRNFRQYLNSIRIEEAKRLLRETDRQIADIARKVGYQTVAHFNRTFRQVEGCSPNEYRSGAVRHEE